MIQKPLVNIIILNWNGWQDTIECLDSLSRISYPNYRVILIDNDSANDSCDRILDYLQETFPAKCIVEKWNQTEVLFENDIITFIKNSENAGFARGCNLGMDYVDFKSFGSLVLLLNNDTEVEPDFLGLLVDFYTSTDYRAVCPQIRFHYDKETIWNCGGRLRGGFKGYYYKGKSCRDLPKKEFLPITLITGCALLYDFKDLGMLTDKFFFGEEDFEFSFRNNANDVKMASLLTSIVYHKVGQSTKIRNAKIYSTLHIEYLNRLIDYKAYVKNKPYYLMWLIITVLSLYRFLSKKGEKNICRNIKFIRSIIRDSRKYSKVDVELYSDILKRY